MESGPSAGWWGKPHPTRVQWRSFLRKNRLEDGEIDLGRVVRAIRRFILPAAEALASALSFDRVWPPGGPWQPE